MSVNKVILIGNIGADPEVRYLDSNKVVANMRLATTEGYKDKEGNRVTQTEWHNLEMWDDLAKIAEKYIRKGKEI
jgi:single-strand DNA-binding protein